MAARASRRGRDKGVPIQVQAQYLREGSGCAPAGPLSGFAIVLDDEAHSQSDVRGKTPWQQKDLDRAIDAASEAGLSCYRVEIAPDGTISIIVGAPSKAAAAAA